MSARQSPDAREADQRQNISGKCDPRRAQAAARLVGETAAAQPRSEFGSDAMRPGRVGSR